MLFKLLKLFGLDVPAKVAAAKSMVEQRAEEVAQYAGQTVQTAAVIAALSALAGVLGAMAVGVGLYALYRVDADTYGVYAGLGVVGGVLVAAALILYLVARAKGQFLSSRRIFKPPSPVPTAASSPTRSSPPWGQDRYSLMRLSRRLQNRPAICLSLGRCCWRSTSNIRRWTIQCSINSWETYGSQRAEPPMRRWRKQRISCATETDSSSSCCWAVLRLSAGFWHDKILISD